MLIPSRMWKRFASAGILSLLMIWTCAGQGSSSDPLRVNIRTNKTALRFFEGDTLSITVRSNRDCYLRVIYLDAGGTQLQIFPNFQDSVDHVNGGVEYQIPTRFEISPPFGNERIRAFVSTEKIPSFDLEDRGDGLTRFKHPVDSVIARVRRNGIFGEYAEDVIDITTIAKTAMALQQEFLPPASPAIDLRHPQCSEYMTEDQDSLVIDCLVTDRQGVMKISINGEPLGPAAISDTVSLKKKFGLQPGENHFRVVAENRAGEKSIRSFIVDRTEHKFRGQRWAVVVGISDYQHPEIPDLKYAHRDAEAFYEFLKSPNGGAFPDDHIRLLKNNNATRNNIHDAMFSFLSQTQPEDLVILFFSGHGFSRGEGFSFFISQDADPYQMTETAFDMEEIRKALKTSIKANRVILFADACNSGAVNHYLKGTRAATLEQNLINRYLVELAKTKPGIVSLTSCDQSEVSGESWIFWEHGIFTFVLLSGLGGRVTDTAGKVKPFESADNDNDGIVTLGELSSYISKYVPGYTKNKQNPQISHSQFDTKIPLSVIR